VATTNIPNSIDYSKLIPKRDVIYSQLDKKLGLEPPFYISKTIDDETNYEMLFVISCVPKATFTSPCCGVPNCKVHSRHPRKIRHLDFWHDKSFLLIDLPLIQCSKCGKRHILPLSFLEKGHNLSVEFQQKILAFSELMPFSSVSKVLGESDKRLADVVNKHVNKAREDLDFSNVSCIGVDETSVSRGHNYISVFVDMITRSVLFATEGKDSSVLCSFSDELQRNRGHPFQIRDAAIDMSPAFIAGINNTFPCCEITFDKFHVIKNMNDIVDKIRRQEVKEQPILKGTRYIWLHNPGNLTARQQDDLTRLSKRNLKTSRAYRFKLALQEAYKCDDIVSAETAFRDLINWGVRTRIELIKTFSQTIRSHLPRVLRYFVSGLTSGVVEGINTKIQEIKRRSRGFPNVNHFINMIYLSLSRLNILKLYGTGKATTS
jgi:transposase